GEAGAIDPGGDEGPPRRGHLALRAAAAAAAWLTCGGHRMGRPVSTTIEWSEVAMKKILVAFDGTEPSRRGLDMAADLAHAFGASVSVISVIPVHPGRVPVDPWD